LRVGGTIIPTLASFPAGHVEPELVARLLDTLNQDSVTLVALMGFWGEIGPKDWQAFRRRLEEKIGWVPPVEAIAATPTLFEPPVDDFNLCDVVFSKQNLDSSAEIVAPSLNQKMTYAELMREVQTIASYLHESGARPGHIIGVAAPDDLCTSSIMLAALWIGCTFVPLNHHASPDNFASMLNSSKPDLIIYDIACVRPHGDSLAQSSSSKVELKVFKSSIRSHPIASKNAFNNPLPVSPNTGAVLLFTSGSTGRPKGVLHTHSDFVTCARNYGYFTVDITANDRVYSPSPSFFAYGINTALLTLLCGATYIIATPQKVLDTADILEHHRVSVLFAVPAVFKRLMLNKKSEHIYPALRLCISAGEKLPSRLSHEVSRRLGVPVLDGIGCTETISTFISNRISNNAPGTTGTVVPGFAVRLVNRKGEPCQIGEVGVLLVAGNTLVARYFEADSRANSQFQDGWFDTKDMFFMDTNHRFYCVGRSSSVIKINGCWFSPETIESVLQTHPLVDECGVGVIIDEFGLPRPKAFVVLRGETETKGLWKELGELSKAQLGKDHYPHLFQAVARLPRTPSGKLLRSALNTQTVC
ncbi:MAG: AMP-binding protein, partial [Myxococcota bacterium]